MVYVIKRVPVKYTDGTYSPETYFKGNPLGMFVELTLRIDEASRYNRKADAKKVAQGLGRQFYVSRLEQSA